MRAETSRGWDARVEAAAKCKAIRFGAIVHFLHSRSVASGAIRALGRTIPQNATAPMKLLPAMGIGPASAVCMNPANESVGGFGRFIIRCANAAALGSP